MPILSYEVNDDGISTNKDVFPDWYCMHACCDEKFLYVAGLIWELLCISVDENGIFNVLDVKELPHNPFLITKISDFIYIGTKDYFLSSEHAYIYRYSVSPEGLLALEGNCIVTPTSDLKSIWGKDNIIYIAQYYYGGS